MSMGKRVNDGSFLLSRRKRMQKGKDEVKRRRILLVIQGFKRERVAKMGKGEEEKKRNKNRKEMKQRVSVRSLLSEASRRCLGVLSSFWFPSLYEPLAHLVSSSSYPPLSRLGEVTKDGSASQRFARL